MGDFVGTPGVATHFHAGQHAPYDVELSTVDRAVHAWNAVALGASANSGSAYRGSNPCLPVSTQPLNP